MPCEPSSLIRFGAESTKLLGRFRRSDDVSVASSVRLSPEILMRILGPGSADMAEPALFGALGEVFFADPLLETSIVELFLELGDFLVVDLL